MWMKTSYTQKPYSMKKYKVSLACHHAQRVINLTTNNSLKKQLFSYVLYNSFYNTFRCHRVLFYS